MTADVEQLGIATAIILLGIIEKAIFTLTKQRLLDSVAPDRRILLRGAWWLGSKETRQGRVSMTPCSYTQVANSAAIPLFAGFPTRPSYLGAERAHYAER